MRVHSKKRGAEDEIKKQKNICNIFSLNADFQYEQRILRRYDNAADGYSLADFGSKVGSITITGAAVDGYTQAVEAYTRGSGSNVETFHKYTAIAAEKK